MRNTFLKKGNNRFYLYATGGTNTNFIAKTFFNFVVLSRSGKFEMWIFLGLTYFLSKLRATEKRFLNAVKFVKIRGYLRTFFAKKLMQTSFAKLVDHVVFFVFVICFSYIKLKTLQSSLRNIAIGKDEVTKQTNGHFAWRLSGELNHLLKCRCALLIEIKARN